jgi:hypothetical protein
VNAPETRPLLAWLSQEHAPLSAHSANVVRTYGAHEGLKTRSIGLPGQGHAQGALSLRMDGFLHALTRLSCYRTEQQASLPFGYSGACKHCSAPLGNSIASDSKTDSCRQNGHRALLVQICRPRARTLSQGYSDLRIWLMRFSQHRGTGDGR